MAGDGIGVETAVDETGTEEGVTEPPKRAVFFNTITRPPRSPRTSAGGTTPNEVPEPSEAGDAPEAGTADTISEVEAETPALASSGKCTFAITVCTGKHAYQYNTTGTVKQITNYKVTKAQKYKLSNTQNTGLKGRQRKQQYAHQYNFKVPKPAPNNPTIKTQHKRSLLASETTGDEDGGTEPPERAVFFNTTTRPPCSPAGGTTPQAEPEPSDAGDVPEASSTGTTPEGNSETPPLAAAGTWTSATTEECDTSGTTPPSLEDPPSSNSPTSAQAEDCQERLGIGCTSSEPDGDPETRSTQTGQTDTLRRTAASSATRGSRSSTVGGPTATPAPNTAWAHGEGAVTGTTAEEREDGGAWQTGAGRTTGTSGQ
ncbi:uncharacterized protein [Procambarus clarkii]|uniref:uncharacterized protein n=1 Tax=Procambarus clarkii TaxID=6728 RepID=UPI0037434F66